MVPAVETIFTYTYVEVKPVEMIMATHLVVNCCVGTASSCRHDHSCKRVTLCLSHDRECSFLFWVCFACNAH